MREVLAEFQMDFKFSFEFKFTYFHLDMSISRDRLPVFLSAHQILKIQMKVVDHKLPLRNV